MSRTMALNPPPCRSKSVARRACSIRDQGLPVTFRCAVFRMTSTALDFVCAADPGREYSALGLALAPTRSPTAFERPRTSLRGCEPKPPPGKPLFIGAGTRYFSCNANDCGIAAGTFPEAPQRTQRSLRRSTPDAAADSGSSAFETSIHAHTLALRVIWPDKGESNRGMPGTFPPNNLCHGADG